MPLAGGLACAVQVLISGTWTTLTSDVIAGLSIQYGLSGNRPTDCLATTGQCTYRLRNDAGNSGAVVGYYSPLHASVRTGWTFGLTQRVVFSYETPMAVTSITRSSSTATVTTTAVHGLTSFDYVEISGAGEAEYNGIVQITVTGASTFTYTVSGTPASPASGTIETQRKYIKFYGKIESIEPTPGLTRTQDVTVTAYDFMRDLHDTDLINVALQVNQTESAVISALLTALPSANRPPLTSLDAGLDPLAYALDDIGDGVKAASALNDLILSSYGLGFIKGDGTFRYQNRNTRATTASSNSFSDADVQQLRAPSSFENVYNLVRTTNHPRTVDASNVVLYALTGAPPVVPAGDTITIEGAFRDPNDARRAVGAASTVSLASGTDYAGNSAPDGSGTDLTSDLSITPTVNASRVVFSIQNTGGTDAYLVNGAGTTKLQIRGKGLYDNAPRTFESSSGNGDRPITIDMPYCSDDGTAQQIGSLILDQYQDFSAQLESVTLIEASDTTRLRQMLAREPGDVVTISETVTGLSAVDVMILSCAYDLLPGNILSVTWGLGPVIDAAVPNAPTSLTATVESDDSVNLGWTTGSGASGAHTRIYRDGVHIATTAPGTTTLAQGSLTRATDYAWVARHVELSLVSNASNTATARPTVAATGGTVTTSGGYKYHAFSSSGTFQITVEGRIDWHIAGGGGGGGTGIDNGTEPAGSGGGGAGGLLISTDNPEPTGSFTVTIGAAGAAQANGGDTTYRSETAAGGGAGGGFTLGDAGDSGASGGGGAATAGAGGSASGGGGTGNAGGAGYSTGVNNAAGGGGGGGAGGAGAAGTTDGGNGGAGYSLSWLSVGTICAGGKGGRGTGGAGENGVGYGDGGNGNTGNGNNGGTGHAGVAIFRYPI